MITTDKAFADAGRSTINRSIFSDPDMHKRELARVFTRSWLFLAHESQFNKPGDFFTTYMGEDPIIVTRSQDGSYKGLLNSCRHRGMRVCRFDRGNAKVFTCPYHGWAYNDAGALVSVPDEDGAYDNKLNKSEWGLAVVPRIETYKGLIFGTWDTEIPSLHDYLGDFTYYLDILVDPDGEGTEALEGVHKWRMRGNWKFAAEQFAGDMYHAASTHISAIIAEAQLHGGDPGSMDGLQVALDNGHGLGGLDGRDAWANSNFGDETKRWLADYRKRMINHLGRERVEDIHLIHGTAFPNFSLLWVRSNIRVWHPKGPDGMEVYSWLLTPKHAPDFVRRDLLLDYQRHFSASGTWEQDDGEQWNYSTNSHDGFITSQLPLNYEMGKRRGPNARFQHLRGEIDVVNSEINQRRFYERWEELMAVPHPKEVARLGAPAINGAPELRDVQEVLA
jgi:3-phenylpropionate/trans-cinnamate dioxygenase alpha subunit